MNIEMIKRPTWMEINLDYLVHNCKEVQKIVKPNTEVCAVLKADAYQHGSVEVARELIKCGVNRFAVACLTEALQLRNSFPDISIIIFGYTPDYLVEDVIVNDIIQTIYDVDQAKHFSEVAVMKDKTLKIHIKVDTGLNRLGIKPKDDIIEKIDEIYHCPNLLVEGIFTHFVYSDPTMREVSTKQASDFNKIVEKLEERGIYIQMKHVSAAPSVIEMPEMDMDMVRVGVLLYGIYSHPLNNNGRVDIKKIMSLKTRVAQVKYIDEGEGVSYGMLWKATRKSKIATLPIGYADGFNRLLSNSANVLINGKKLPIVGAICMDQCMVDVTGVDVKMGDEAVLIGSDKEYEITLEEVAAEMDTNHCGLLCNFTKRVPRVYTKGGHIIKVVDYILDY